MTWWQYWLVGAFVGNAIFNPQFRKLLAIAILCGIIVLMVVIARS
jgi:hypothetical protein